MRRTMAVNLGGPAVYGQNRSLLELAGRKATPKAVEDFRRLLNTGRVLATGRFVNRPGGQVTHHIRVWADNDGNVQFEAWERFADRWRRVTDSEATERHARDLLRDLCRDALYHALWDAGMGNLAETERLYEELTDTAVDAVIASAWTPIQAAGYVVKALVKDRRA